jgi:carboxyl-terminal processing protease
VGEPSFGKGTVQTMVDLDRIAKNEKPQFGELKMTVAQFFRINGGTTQLRGVIPDIAFPSGTDTGEFGESSFDNALPWVQIKAANYARVGDLGGLLPILLARHAARVKEDKDFQYLQEDIAEFKLQHEKNLISLNEVERRKERDAQDAKQALREARTDATQAADGTSKPPAAKSAHTPSDDGLQANERNLSKELAAEKAQKDAKDVLLLEAVHILGDEVEVLKTGVSLATGAKPEPALLPN